MPAGRRPRTLRRAKTTAADSPRDPLAELQSLSEDELVDRVLIPLFRAIGYERVEKHHGPHELGRDLILWTKGRLGDPEIDVVQVKRFRPSASSSAATSFATVVTQLEQAVESPILGHDGFEHRPTKVYLITPFALDVRTLASRFEKYKSLRHGGLRVVDGPAMLALLHQHCPDVLLQFTSIDQALLPELTNRALAQAIGAAHPTNIDKVYADLAFVVGDHDAKFYAIPALRATTGASHLDPAVWPTFRKKLLTLSETFGVRSLQDTLSRAEANYAVAMAEFEDPSNQQLLANIDRIMSTLQVTTKKALLIIDDLERGGRENRLSRDVALLPYSARAVLHDRDVTTVERLPAWTRFKADYDEAVATARVDEKPIVKSLHKLLSDSLRLSRELAAQRVRVLPAPQYTVTLDTDDLAKRWRAKYNEYVRRVADLNRGCASTDIGRFLREAESLLDTFDGVFSEPTIFRVNASNVGVRHDSVQLRIPFAQVLCAGRSMILLGEAGAGKTTTLQVATIRADSGRPTFYVPLGEISSAVTENVTHEIADRGLRTALERMIVGYIGNRAPSVNADQFTRFLRYTNGMTLLLDGTDEIIDRCPWFFDAARTFADEHPAVQIVVAARDGTRGLQKLPWLRLSLLPFSSDQLLRFAEGWFGETSERVTQIRDHLERNPDYAAVVRNPLLSNILCVLVEHDVPLPDSEVSLYGERLRLLMGDYDSHKKVSRLKRHRDQLELVARKVAFRLHREGRRSAPYRLLKEWALDATGSKLNEELTLEALAELVTPCNLLTRMTIDGQLGFGHLRYQEYLAALELVRNRGVDVIPFLRDKWWFGVLAFFSAMTDEIDELLQRVYFETGNLVASEAALVAMANARPRDERHALLELIERNVVLDLREAGVFDGVAYDEDLSPYSDPDDVEDDDF